MGDDLSRDRFESQSLYQNKRKMIGKLLRAVWAVSRAGRQSLFPDIGDARTLPVWDLNQSTMHFKWGCDARNGYLR